MATYIVDSSDGTTEAALVAYQAERGRVQQAAAQMYQAIQFCELSYAELESKLGDGGVYAALGKYHTARTEPVAEAVGALRAKMADVVGLMQAMQAAYQEGELFPGLPKG